MNAIFTSFKMSKLNVFFHENFPFVYFSTLTMVEIASFSFGVVLYFDVI